MTVPSVVKMPKEQKIQWLSALPFPRICGLTKIKVKYFFGNPDYPKAVCPSSEIETEALDSVV